MDQQSTNLLDDQKQTFWKNRRVLLTGGTRGLGRELALQLKDLDALVTIVARSGEVLKEMQSLSDRIFVIEADISVKEDIHRISGQAVGMMEGIDVLINNASTLGVTPLQSLLDTTCETFEQVLQTNLLGPFRLIKSVIPYMKFHGEGLVINISSDAALSTYPTWGPYSVSKTALDHLTAIWQQELMEEDIQLVSVDPGDMATQMHFDAIPEADPSELYRPAEVARDLLRFLPNRELDNRYSASQWRQLL